MNAITVPRPVMMRPDVLLPVIEPILLDEEEKASGAAWSEAPTEG